MEARTLDHHFVSFPDLSLKYWAFHFLFLLRLFYRSNLESQLSIFFVLLKFTFAFHFPPSPSQLRKLMLIRLMCDAFPLVCYYNFFCFRIRCEHTATSSHHLHSTSSLTPSFFLALTTAALWKPALVIHYPHLYTAWTSRFP